MATLKFIEGCADSGSAEHHAKYFGELIGELTKGYIEEYIKYDLEENDHIIYLSYDKKENINDPLAIDVSVDVLSDGGHTLRGSLSDMINNIIEWNTHGLDIENKDTFIDYETAEDFKDIKNALLKEVEKLDKWILTAKDYDGNTGR